MKIEHLVLHRNRRIFVRVQNRERRAKIRYRILSALEVVCAYCDNLSILPRDGIVVLGQINELGTAFDSPERAVEHHHDILFADVGR